MAFDLTFEGWVGFWKVKMGRWDCWFPPVSFLFPVASVREYRDGHSPWYEDGPMKRSRNGDIKGGNSTLFIFVFPVHQSGHVACVCVCVCVCVLVAQLCPTLCDPMDYSPPDSSIHGISQSRILEWVTIPFSWESSWPRDQTRVFCITSKFFTIWATMESSVHSNPSKWVSQWSMKS